MLLRHYLIHLKIKINFTYPYILKKYIIVVYIRIITNALLHKIHFYEYVEDI